MPNLLLYCSVPEDSQRLAPFVAPIGLGFRVATVEAFLDLTGINQVAFAILPFVATDNMSRLQLIAVATYTEERARRLAKWQFCLGKALQELCWNPDLSEVADILRDEVEIWPQMPVAVWKSYKDGLLAA